eukprot:5353707-Prymnesium_polylepis.1
MECAALALAYLTNDENAGAITVAGAIAPLVALARDGSDGQKEKAVLTLANLVAKDDSGAAGAAVAEADGIEPLRSLARSGTPSQQQWATVALEHIESSTDMPSLGVEQLVRLVGGGAEGLRQSAAAALANLAATNAASRDAIAGAGGVEALVGL